MRCPSCESDNVRRLSVVYDEGSYTETSKSTTNMSGGGVMMAGTAGGVYTSRQAGTTTTTTRGLSELAKKAAPPEKRKPIREFLGMLAGLVVVSLIATAILATLLPLPDFMIQLGAIAFFIWAMRRLIASTKRDLEYNRSEFPDRLEQWKNSWLCSKCGEIYVH